VDACGIIMNLNEYTKEPRRITESIHTLRPVVAIPYERKDPSIFIWTHLFSPVSLVDGDRHGPRFIAHDLGGVHSPKATSSFLPTHNAGFIVKV
jgi:hypothetical protein